MNRKRTLRLRKELLGELGTEHLQQVVGGTHLTCNGCGLSNTCTHPPTLPIGTCICPTQTCVSCRPTTCC